MCWRAFVLPSASPPGVRLNFGPHGVGFSVGRLGLHIGMNRFGARDVINDTNSDEHVPMAEQNY